MFQYIADSDFIQLSTDGGNILPSAFVTMMSDSTVINKNKLPKQYSQCYNNLITNITSHAQATVSNITLSHIFIVKYTKQHNNSLSKKSKGLSIHCDHIDSNTHIFTCVYTWMSSDCIGGNVMYSACNSGYIDKNNRNTICFKPNHKSIYSFIGSYTQHSVSGISSGVRIALVCWFKWNVADVDVVGYVNDSSFVCKNCFHCYTSAKILKYHKCNCEKSYCVIK